MYKKVKMFSVNYCDKTRLFATIVSTSGRWWFRPALPTGCSVTFTPNIYTPHRNIEDEGRRANGGISPVLNHWTMLLVVNSVSGARIAKRRNSYWGNGKYLNHDRP